MLGDVLLAGDYNARTGVGWDFLDPSQPGQAPDGELPLPALPTGLQPRQSQNSGAIFPFGRSLPEVCQLSNMLSLGRVRGDRVGKLTFPHSAGGSVVDYFVATHALFAMHPALIVGESQPESDHRPLCLSIRLHQSNTPAPPQQDHSMPKLRHCPERVPGDCELLAAQLSLDSTSFNAAAWLRMGCRARHVALVFVSNQDHDHGVLADKAGTAPVLPPVPCPPCSCPTPSCLRCAAGQETQILAETHR